MPSDAETQGTDALRRTGLTPVPDEAAPSCEANGMNPMKQTVPHLTADHLRVLIESVENRLAHDDMDPANRQTQALQSVRMWLKSIRQYDHNSIPQKDALLLAYCCHFGSSIPTVEDEDGEGLWYDRKWLMVRNDAVAVIVGGANDVAHCWDSIVLPGKLEAWERYAEDKALALFV